MSTQAIQPPRRSEVMAPLIALLLAVTLLLIGAQASAFWGSRSSAPTQPTTTVFIPTSSDASGSVAHLPAGCRPKAGC